MSQPVTLTDENFTAIANYLLENFGGFQKCRGLIAPPIHATINVTKPIKTGSIAEDSDLGKDGYILPDVYNIADGFSDGWRFWLVLEKVNGRNSTLILISKLTGDASLRFNRSPFFTQAAARPPFSFRTNDLSVNLKIKIFFFRI